MQPQEIAKKLGIPKLQEEQDLNMVMTCPDSYALDDNGKLIGLHLSDRKLSDEELRFVWGLEYLEALNLSGNDLKEVVIPATMKRLRFLNLTGNRSLSQFTFKQGIPSLEKLDISECSLTELSFPSEFEGLQTVEVHKNKLKRLSLEGDFPELNFLDLSENQLKNISSSGSLPKLQNLYLEGGNKVQDIGFLNTAPALKTLNLSNNEVADLSPIRHLLERGVSFVLENSGSGVLLKGCPLTTPPIETVKEGNDAINRYFEELGKGDAKLYEAKVLIVGESEAGKTSLLRKLENENAELPTKEERTRGIEIVRLSFKTRKGQQIFMNIWDFGGQQIYHSTHRFFLTHRSLYILLTNTSRQEDNFDYWIPNIYLFGGNSPILAVKNKKYKYDKEITIARFIEKFNVQGRVLPVNLLTNEGLPKLIETIYSNVEQLPVIGSTLPKSWVAVRLKLEKMAQKHHYIDYFQFQQLCRDEGINDDVKIQDLGKYLHDLGVILWYHSLEPLKNKVILVPNWATNAVYKIIDDESILERKGHFNENDIKRLWMEKRYNQMHSELKALMEAFKLCYKKKDGSGYIIPSLLPADPPDQEWDYSDNLCLEYKYGFMPKGIINELTAELSYLIPGDQYVWGRGVFLEDQLAEAKIEEDWVKRTISVNTKGIDARTLMRIIMLSLENIHKTYPGIQYTKHVPCPCEDCRKSVSPNFFSYNKLIESLENGNKQFYCNDGQVFVDIENILFKVGIELPEKHPRGTKEFHLAPEKMKEEPSSSLNIFISYSRKDQDYANTLRRYLNKYEEDKKIKIWYDQEIMPGEEWDAQIKEKLESSDIILFLISMDFLASTYINEVEIKRAVEKHKVGRVTFIPIIVRPSLWKEDYPDLQKVQALPENAKAIINWSNPDNAWYDVVKGVRSVIQQKIKDKNID